MQTRQAMDVQRNTQALSRYYSCSGKAKLHISVCVCVCVFVFWSEGVRVHPCSLTYPERKAYAPYYIIVCDFPGSTVFFHMIS